MFINRPAADASKAIFCLAPTGLGFGVRVYHAMADGCIPVVISDNVTQPWEGDFLPYSLFAVRLPESDIPRCVAPHPTGKREREREGRQERRARECGLNASAEASL